MRKYLIELKLRWSEPAGTFMRNLLIWAGSIGSIAATLTELLLPVLADPEISHEWKDVLRPFYGICFGLAMAAKLTVKDKGLLESKKESLLKN